MWMFGWVVLALILVTYNAYSPNPVNTHGGQWREGDKDIPKCNRAACWDDKSGHYVSGGEWDKRQRERNSR